MSAAPSSVPPDGTAATAPGARPHDDLPELSLRLMQCGQATMAREPFFRSVSEILMAHAGCDAVEIRTYDGPVGYRWKSERGGTHELSVIQAPDSIAGWSPS